MYSVFFFLFYFYSILTELALCHINWINERLNIASAWQQISGHTSNEISVADVKLFLPPFRTTPGRAAAVSCQRSVYANWDRATYGHRRSICLRLPVSTASRSFNTKIATWKLGFARCSVVFAAAMTLRPSVHRIVVHKSHHHTTSFARIRQTRNTII